MDETGMMHGQDWRGEDLAGWYAAEKLDGCRAYWDGTTLWSRGGLAIKAPAEVLVGLPPGFALDGVEVVERLEFAGQHGVVPAGVQGELVVGDDVGADLGLCQAFQAQAGHGGQPEALRGLCAAVAGDDAVVRVDEHRVGEAEFADGGGDLGDLPGRVGAAVARVGHELGDREVFEARFFWRVGAIFRVVGLVGRVVGHLSFPSH